MDALKDPLLYISEFIPKRLLFATLKVSILPKSTSKVHYFSIDDELVYKNFYEDFGPLNLAQLYRYCAKLNTILRSQTLEKKLIVHCTTLDEHKRANAAYLIASYAIIYLGKSPAEAFSLLELGNNHPFIEFRDASKSASNGVFYIIIISHCLNAIYNAKKAGFFNFDDFDCEEYEYYEQIQNGDFNWIVPGKFIAFCSPHDQSNFENGCPVNAPELYVPYFRLHNVSTIVRLHSKRYDSKRFTENGFQHKDLAFISSYTPSDEILKKFLEICEDAPGAIGVHCTAGLARTGLLIGCYIMKHLKWKANEIIAWLRICRPGSVVSYQQEWMLEKEQEMWKEGKNFRKLHRNIWKRKFRYPLYSLDQKSKTSIFQSGSKMAINGDGDIKKMHGSCDSGAYFSGTPSIISGEFDELIVDTAPDPCHTILNALKRRGRPKKKREKDRREVPPIPNSNTSCENLSVKKNQKVDVKKNKRVTCSVSLRNDTSDEEHINTSRIHSLSVRINENTNQHDIVRCDGTTKDSTKNGYNFHKIQDNTDITNKSSKNIDQSLKESDKLYLTNWSPNFQSKRLKIEGNVKTEGFEINGNVNPNKGRYLTSKVIERVTSTIIKTKKRHYVLEGKLSAADAVKYETPSFILNSFSAGVPEKWEVYRDQWRKFVKEQRHNLFGSGASLSSWSSASSFDQASGFLSNTRNSIHLGQSNKNKVGDGTFTNGSSIMTSSTDDISRVLGHEKSPIKYSWEYLAEGKKARLKSYDTSTLNEGPTKALPNENLKNDKNASNGKNNQSSTVTSVEDINFSANSTSRRKGLRKTNINNNTSNKLSSSQTRESAKIHPVNVSMSPTTRSVPNEPKFVKELFVIVKNDNRYKKSKVGRCIVCSATYSIPYIERHITDKHSSFVLDSNSSKISTNSHSIQRSSTRSNYLRPRVVITRLGSKDTINTSGKAVTPHVSKMKLNVTKSKNNTSQINNIESSRKRTCTPNVETNERQGVRKHSPQYQKNKSTKSHSNAQKKSRNINLPMNDSMNMQKNRFCGKTSKPSKSNKNYATKRSDSEFKQNRPIQNRQTKTDKECKNQAKTDSVSKKVNKEPEANLRQMVIQPITIKDRQTNTRVLNALNKNHKDDIFLCNKWKKTDTAKDAKQGPNDILADLFDSDSENDLSLHSARTPIGRFFDRSESKTPAHNLDNPEEDIYLTCGKKDEFQQDAFINRKVKETRKRGRLTSAFSSNNANILQSFTKSSRNLVEQQSNDLVKPISNLLAQDENAPDDTDEEMESYFSEEPSTFTRSIADPPSGLIDMFNKEKAKRQHFSSIRRNY